MNYFDYLRKRFPLYIISGIVFGCVLFGLIAVGRYRANITGVVAAMETIVLNKDKIGHEIKEIDDLKHYFKKAYGLDLANVRMERHVFRALDALKSHFQNAAVSVSRFEDAGGSEELPVAISTPVRNYGMVLEYVRYLESFTLPDFEIRTLTIMKDQLGVVTMNINGVLVMPSLPSGGRT